MPDNDQIPLVDIGLQNRQVWPEVLHRIQNLVISSDFVLGPELSEFEASFAEFCKARHCIGVGNGSDALELMLRAGGVEPGQEVVLPANTFIATALAAVRIGAKPVLVDCDPISYLMDVQQVKECIRDRTAAVIAVHLYGQMVEMTALRKIAKASGISLFEDCAQAHGASRSGQSPGTVGLAGSFSFYPGKNLGAFGDGGAIVTNSDEIARRAKALRNHGIEKECDHTEIGFNSRLDTVQAVVLTTKLDRLNAWNGERAVAASVYKDMLKGASEIVLPQAAADATHAWHLFVVRVPHRDEILDRLRSRGIMAAVHYRRPIHLHKACEFLGYRAGEFPNAERASRELLSLPIFPGITKEQQERVARELISAL